MYACGFRIYFTPLTGVLFAFPSRYWFTIGHRGVFSLTRWSWWIPTGFLVSRRTQVLSQASSLFRLRGCHPVSPDFPFRSPIMSSCSFSTVLQPRSSDRFGLLPFRSPLLRESFVYFLFLQVLRCFSSLSLASLKLFIHFRIPGLYSRWVPPFGHRRISACLLLTVAFRCLLRPSSPLCA